ncbi:adenylyl cyclase-associated protein 2-like [Protopterus annectens]|uniref:adenylyl cyclase-associated protein 2-like n=1 Tax=Protopterus annectens TaxID=7888 RepID=UPI001CFA4F79|nr:adenylyl cyclase-associated protein 2-like [Protopterus annectens]
MAEVPNLVDRLEKAVVQLESVCSRLYGPASLISDVVNGVNGGPLPYVEAFDTFLIDTVAVYLKNSKIIGGDVEKHAELVNAAFQAQRAFLLLAAQYQQPHEHAVPSPNGLGTTTND